MSFEGQDGFCAKKERVGNLALGQVRAEMSAGGGKAVAREGKNTAGEVWGEI